MTDPTLADVIAAVEDLDNRLDRRLNVVDLELRALRASMTIMQAEIVTAVATAITAHEQRRHQ